MTDKPDTLTDALSRIMAGVGHIEKSGTAPAAMGGFKFVPVTAVMDALQPLLVIERIALLPRATLLRLDEFTTGGGRRSWLATVHVQLFIRRGDEELLWSEGVGQGADTQDKAAGKATTGAVKQALLNALAVPTGDDPDASDVDAGGQPRQQGTRRPPRPAAARQASDPQAAAEGAQTPAGQVTRADLARRVSEVIAQVNALTGDQAKVVNTHSIRNHLKKPEAGGFDGVSSLLQHGTGAQIVAFGRYLQGKLEEAQATQAEPTRAEDMSDADALAAGAALAGKAPRVDP